MRLLIMRRQVVRFSVGIDTGAWLVGVQIFGNDEGGVDIYIHLLPVVFLCFSTSMNER